MPSGKYPGVNVGGNVRGVKCPRPAVNMLAAHTLNEL